MAPLKSVSSLLIYPLFRRSDDLNTIPSLPLRAAAINRLQLAYRLPSKRNLCSEMGGFRFRNQYGANPGLAVKVSYLRLGSKCGCVIRLTEFRSVGSLLRTRTPPS